MALPRRLVRFLRGAAASGLAASALLVAGGAVAYDWRPLPEKAKAPKDNPTTRAKVELGKQLFFDPRLSETGTISCNTCHYVLEGGDDGRPSSMGVHGRIGPRNAPTVWNAAFHSTQFWDGRAPSLEEQAKGPLVAHPEMGMPSHDKVMARVKQVPAYRRAFKEVFGGGDPLTIANAAKAIAAFERTLITPNSPYDRYVKGEKDALTGQQVRGMKTFHRVGCTSCHSGPAFNGPQMDMPEGKGFFGKFPTYSDSGYVEKYDLAADAGRNDAHLFKVPTLRNIALTAPYFHNGAVPTLSEAVRVMARTQLDKELTGKQMADIVAFLEALTGELPEMALPRLPSRSGHTIVEAGESQVMGGAEAH